MKKPEYGCTTDYDKFELHEFNRPLHNSDRLYKSMEKHGYKPEFPIGVVRTAEGKFKIIFGHNRFVTARSLGIEVYYVVVDEETEFDPADEYFTTKSWSLNDFLVSHNRADTSEHYVFIRDYVNETGISLSAAISMMGGESAGSSNKNDSFRRGTYQTTKEGRLHAHLVARIASEMRDQGVDFATHKNMVNAISKFSLWSILEKRRTVDEYLEDLCKLYVRQTSENPLRLQLFVEEESLGRRPADNRK